MLHTIRPIAYLAVVAFITAGCADRAASNGATSDRQAQGFAFDSTNITKAIEHTADSIGVRLGSYEQVEVDLEASSQQGIAEGFFKGDQFGKVEAKHYGEMGRRHAHYFFDGGRLILVADTSFYYDQPLSSGNVSVDSMNTARMFFRNDSLVFLQKEGEEMSGSTSWRRTLREAERLTDRLRKARH